MRASLCWLIAPGLLAVMSTNAQTTNNAIDSFLSEALSVYTEVTSILASDAQATPTSTSSSSSSTTSSSSSSVTSINMRSSSSPASSASLAGAASTSSTTASPSHNGVHHHNNLAIILGSVLGALVLGLLILSILFCCHRRRRTRSSEHRVLSPADEEVDTWRGSGGMEQRRGGAPLGSHATAGTDHPMAAAAAPNMAEHPAFKNFHENPFVPVPPAPRRTAPNSRPGLTDGTIPGQEPFVSDHSRRSELSSDNSISTTGHRCTRHSEEALAAGAGGAALGAAAMRHHKNHGDRPNLEKRYSDQGRVSRKPLPSSLQTDDATLLHGNQAHELDGTPYTKPALSPFNSAGHARSPSQEALLTGTGVVGAGALEGAAVAEHRKHHDQSADSGFYSHHDDNKSDERALRSSEALVSPISAEDERMYSTGPPKYEMAAHDDAAPYTSRRRSSVAPAAALGAHDGVRDVSPSATLGSHNNNRQTRNSTPPAVPSRSPKRTRLSDIPYDESSPLPGSHSNSDDSTFRLSSSIPGGWRRDSPIRDSVDSDQHLRNSGINQHGRRSNSPRTSVDPSNFPIRHSVPSSSAHGARRQSLGSGISPNMRSGGRRQSQSPSTGINPARRRMSPGDITSERVRLSDLRAEEEQLERQRQRGRQYGGMQNEWQGGSGYDGYEGRYHGVGQAL